MKLAPTLLAASLFALPVAAQDSAPAPVRQIMVIGEGQVETAPDMATITLGVTTEGETAAAALAANSTAMTEVLGRIEAAGIEARDVQTTGLSLNPTWESYRNAESAPRITGYAASNMVTVRVRALDTLGAVLDASVADGANGFNGLVFGLIDPAPATDEARRRAVADARHRAELYAEAAGVTLGPVVSISEAGGYGGPQPMMRMAAEAAPPVPVAGGEISIGASVQVIFAIGE